MVMQESNNTDGIVVQHYSNIALLKAGLLEQNRRMGCKKGSQLIPQTTQPSCSSSRLFEQGSLL